jgi:hypothetical protein
MDIKRYKMKVNVTFEITPQEALELMQGTSSMVAEDMKLQAVKAMTEGTKAVYKEAAEKVSMNSLFPPAWWGNQTVYGDKDK